MKQKSKNTPALGKSRSVGTVVKPKTTDKPKTDKQKRQAKPNRSLPSGTVVKSSTATITTGKKSSPPMQGRAGNEPKKQMPLKTDSKPRAGRAFTRPVAKAEPAKKAPNAKGGNKVPAVALKRPSKSLGNLTTTDKKDASSQNVSKDKKASFKTSLKPQVSKNYHYQAPPPPGLSRQYIWGKLMKYSSIKLY